MGRPGIADDCRTVFIDDFVPVSSSLLVANACLLSHGADIARGAAEQIVSTASVSLGPARTRAESLVVPLIWSTGAREPFVELQGDLQTERMGPTSTHLRLSASCQIAVDPPGHRAQESAARRIAEQSVRAFLQRVGASLEHHSRPLGLA
jgi:hypothetical protein